MSRKDIFFLLGMSVLVAFIWLRNLSWVSTIDDTLPILVALPMFFWLEWPWKFQEKEFHPTKGIILGFATLFFLGVITNLTLVLTLAWCFLLWTWIKQRVTPEFHERLGKLMILPLMAFPWVTLDAYSIGWYFRLTGAWTTSQVFAALGFQVSHEGTQLMVNNLPVSVDVSCAGLNTLQSMLIAGSMLAYIQLGETKRYWWNIGFLAAVAWLANTLRICMLTAVAVLVSPEFAMGPFHESGGWVVLFTMFCLCWGVFTLQQPRSPSQEAT